MEFKKINENTFECLLSKEDLEDFDMTMEDFLKDQEKTMDFMQKIIERSEEEIDFEPTGDSLSMQIAPLPEDGLALVFSSRPAMSGLELLNHVRELLKNHMELLNDEQPEQEEQEPEEPQPKVPSGMEHRADFMDLNGILDDVMSKGKRKNTRRTEAAKAAAYRFRQFSDLEAFCKTWQADKPVKSQLLKPGSTSEYLLVMEQGKLSQQAYARLGETLSEYAQFVTDHPLKIAELREHASVVIDKNAIATLRDL